MKTILIVDDEPSLTFSLKAGLEAYDKHFRILTADHGGAAVELVESTAIDLMLTDLKMPGMDGFQLLAYMKTNFPSVPSIVMTAFYTPEVERRLRVANAITLVEKPIDFDELMRCISVALNTREGEGVLRGIPLSGFLQLIEMEEKTCLLEVRGEDNLPGLFYFNQGELYDTLFKGLRGEEAVYEMLALDNVRISFKTPPMKKIKKRIGSSLTKLLMDGAGRRDDAGNGVSEEWGMNVDAVIDAVEEMDLHKNREREEALDAAEAPAPTEVSAPGEDVNLEEILEAAEGLNVDDIMEPAGEPESGSGFRFESVIVPGEDVDPRDNEAVGTPRPGADFPVGEGIVAGEDVAPRDNEAVGTRRPGADFPVDDGIVSREEAGLRRDGATGKTSGAEMEITEEDLVFILDDEDGADFGESQPEIGDDAVRPEPNRDAAPSGAWEPSGGAAAGSDMNQILEKMRDVIGFRTVGVFSPQGEMIAEANATDQETAELGALANEALMKAQKATEAMGLGRGRMVHIETRTAQVVTRCFNEPEESGEGGAHIHMLLILDRKCNLAMAKMKMESVLQELAPAFR